MGEWVNAGRVDEITEPGARGFEDFFVVHADSMLRAYRNACPHTGASLEWLENEFLDLDKQYIQCSVHGALFQISDGVCLHGPCLGEALQALPLEVRDEELWVEQPDSVISE